ncbi:MAG: histidine phosphatase family protein [Acidimicrobiales bacterium]|jgi:probable phosphoglycerate mutase|nr:histidine phosphatase family protein [Acidimicrobiales bacterium]MDP6280313.1 histidine phosphatase family protein [Acidimicrobiales bacterium]MDP7117932.1 histidine phosphatase family protein [Acidimicrobiales bacterium]MDP7410202.1 histidine phosphatase family protein [Acidimicrobiales bacterium]MEE1521981.1 histidine phosphatase family protein [Acidimicrobiales bacterium]|tara:strand:+ start:8829 stop:9470 length:642 start_codon:yes stop_codon:yes gene_type:complete
MSSTLVLFVRHGRTPTTGTTLPGRAPGLHLSAEGLRQADAVATGLAGASAGMPGGGVAAVYSSPMERTRETAAPIARAVGRRVRTAPGLIECDFGRWTGRRLKELSRLKAWRSVQRQPSTFRFPGGESFAEMQARITGQVAELVLEHPGETIVCVSHADPIKAALSAALGSPLDMFQRLVVGPCSVSAVLHTDDHPVVLSLNGSASVVSPAAS